MAIPGSSAELSEQMRLLLVNYEYPPVGAGAATATQAIARNLVALGHDVTVLTGSYRDLPRESNEVGVTIRRILCLRREADRSNILEMFGFTLSALLALPSVRARYRPEALIAFFSLPSGPVGLAAHFFYGIPYLVSLRGGDVPGLTPEVSWMHKLLSPLRRLVLRNAVAVVANSEGLRDLSRAADPIPVHVIPNGVDTDFFRPSPESWVSAGERFRILFVGRFQAQKNLAVLLEELAALREQRPGKFEIHLVGDGPLRTELKIKANNLRLSDDITWHGWLSRDELSKICRSCHCFVNPSHYEGMPNAVLEAMACAKPIVASAVPGNDAVVQHGLTGFLFPLDDPASLRESLQTLIDDPARAEEMGRLGRAWVTRDFSWERVTAAYLELFERQETPKSVGDSRVGP
jgi:glycosyltransferase involved in cell wall biosynthesis